MLQQLARLTVCSLILIVPLCRAEDAPTGPIANVPELKALAAYIGTWDNVIKAKPAPWTPQGFDATDVGVARWTLDGRFVELRSETKQDNKHGLSLLTYDSELKAYRSWWFHTDGNNNASTGQFDEKTRTFSMVADLGNGVKSTLTDHFIDDSNREWHMVVKDANGQILLEMEAKSVKRK